MNLINFFKDVAEQYNTEQRCGFCWTFKKVKGEAGLNTLRLTDSEKCCVHIVLTYERKSNSERYNFETGARTEMYLDNQFTIYVVKTSDLGRNYGDEIKGHNETESVSASIIQPLFNCLTGENVIDLCYVGDITLGIVQWSAEEVLFLGDQNFSGIKINGVFREPIST